MVIIDTQQSVARLSLAEITAAGTRYTSDPVAFSVFAEGLRPRPWLLAASGPGDLAAASAGFAFFGVLMHEVMPHVYDVRHLNELGGRFALRLSGLGPRGEFTVIAMNRRVLTLAGLPRDEATGQPVVDAEIGAGAFLAFWNDFLARLALTTLFKAAIPRAALLRAA